MKAIILVGAMLIGVGAAASSRAVEAVSPDIFQTQVIATIPANSAGILDVPVVTTPATKRLVIQSVTFFTVGGSAGSSARVFLATSIFNTFTYWAVPEVYNDGLLYPSTTLSATFYAGGGTNVFINAYRTGDTTSAEQIYVAVSGYYVAKP